jgi:hexosaminidase
VTAIAVTQESADASALDDADESYTMKLSDGVVEINAPQGVGALWALQTLRQLSFRHSSGRIYMKGPFSITDAPRFAHRGLNIDVSRHFYPKKTLFRLIDAMAATKLNRLHVHASDSQSWPFAVPSLPELAEKGAYAPWQIYSEADLEDLLEYGRARGVHVYLEIDLPGHTNSIGSAYPDLVVGSSAHPWGSYAAQPPAGQLRLNDPNVHEFLGTLLGDFGGRLEGRSQLFHTGGDEFNVNVYQLQENLRTSDKDTLRPHVHKIVLEAHDKLRSFGLTPVVWEEMLHDWAVPMERDTIIQTWKEASSIADAVRKGHRVIAGSYRSWYLDCGAGNWVDPPRGKSVGDADTNWCGPVKSWRNMYTYNPVAGLLAEEAKLVIGGEVHMWSEQTDEHNVDSKVWPRAAAAAEVLWSGATTGEGAGESPRPLEEASPRLLEFRERLVAQGVEAEPLQQLWCLQHPGECLFD